MYWSLWERNRKATSTFNHTKYATYKLYRDDDDDVFFFRHLKYPWTWKTKNHRLRRCPSRLFSQSGNSHFWLMPNLIFFGVFFFPVLWPRQVSLKAPPWIPLNIFSFCFCGCCWSKTGLEFCRWPHSNSNVYIYICANSALWQCERKAAASQRVRMRMTLHFLQESERARVRSMPYFDKISV